MFLKANVNVFEEEQMVIDHASQVLKVLSMLKRIVKKKTNQVSTSECHHVIAILSLDFRFGSEEDE
jgi:hypothetical protein